MQRPWPDGNAGFPNKPYTTGETMGKRSVSVFRAYRFKHD